MRRTSRTNADSLSLRAPRPISSAQAVAWWASMPTWFAASQRRLPPVKEQFVPVTADELDADTLARRCRAELTGTGFP
jgi:hypothetical protein